MTHKSAVTFTMKSYNRVSGTFFFRNVSLRWLVVSKGHAAKHEFVLRPKKKKKKGV